MDVSRKSWILMVLSWFSSMCCVIDMGFTGFYTASYATPRSSSLKKTIYKQRFTMGRQEHHSNAKHNVNAWTMYLFISHRWSFSHSFSEPFSPPTFSHSFSEPFPTNPQKGSPDWWELKQIESLQLKFLPPTFPSSHHFPSCRLAKCCPSSCCILSSSARSSCCFLWASMAFSSWSRSRSRLGGAMNCSGCLGARGNSFSSSMGNIPSGSQR